MESTAGISNDYGLYVHIPFCISKCPYCDFNSQPIDNPSKIEALYGTALSKELECYLNSPDWQARTCTTVYFGGGTPSLFSPKLFEIVLKTLRTNGKLCPSSEITIEANPGTVKGGLSVSRLLEIKELGVNRISLGAQSFSQSKLERLGRIHSVEDVYESVENVKAASFSSFNLDLIRAVQEETVSNWEEELTKAIALSPYHLATYDLTIEKGTMFFAAQQAKTLRLPNEDDRLSMFVLTQKLLSDAGFEHYEISNYAQPGHQSKHNVGYWIGKDYLGIGAGAASFSAQSANKGKSVHGRRWKNVGDPFEYLNRLKIGKEAVAEKEVIDDERARLEFFLLRLRTAEGISISSYERKFGESFVNRYQRLVDRLTAQNLITGTGDQLQLSSNGILVADSVISSFALE